MAAGFLRNAFAAVFRPVRTHGRAHRAGRRGRCRRAGAMPLSTDAILRWINDYRHRPDPERLPMVVKALSGLQAFKDAETCGAYIGFIAGVLGANPTRAPQLIDAMLSIAPSDRWVLVRAIAYSGLPNWKDLLISVGDRMPERHEMINRYLEGELPTLDQIAYPTHKPGMFDKIKVALKIGDGDKKPVALQPSPELIDVLWGYYLATGAYKPIGQIIKLLPLADDRDSVDNLTTGSAAKFTLASNAVRDLTSAGHAQMVGEASAEGDRQGAQRRNRHRRGCRHRRHAQTIAGGDRAAQAKGPQLEARTHRYWADRPGSAGGGLYRRRGRRPSRTGRPLCDRRRDLFGGHAIHLEPMMRV